MSHDVESFFMKMWVPWHFKLGYQSFCMVNDDWTVSRLDQVIKVWLIKNDAQKLIDARNKGVANKHWNKVRFECSSLQSWYSNEPKHHICSDLPHTQVAKPMSFSELFQFKFPPNWLNRVLHLDGWDKSWNDQLLLLDRLSKSCENQQKTSIEIIIICPILGAVSKKLKAKWNSLSQRISGSFCACIWKRQWGTASSLSWR